ncbi:hypothetical protein D3C84_883250 [compost metagenome]
MSKRRFNPIFQCLQAFEHKAVGSGLTVLQAKIDPYFVLTEDKLIWHTAQT